MALTFSEISTKPASRPKQSAPAYYHLPIMLPPVPRPVDFSSNTTEYLGCHSREHGTRQKPLLVQADMSTERNLSRAIDVLHDFEPGFHKYGHCVSLCTHLFPQQTAVQGDEAGSSSTTACLLRGSSEGSTPLEATVAALLSDCFVLQRHMVSAKYPLFVLCFSSASQNYCVH
jgi:hypothetical protein